MTVFRFTERTRVISALGIVQILAWGSTFYLLAVLSGPIGAETGWSPALVTSGASVGLLASGLVARRVGALIQAQGGRRVMAAGMVLIACGLAVLSAAQSPVVFVLAWLIMGIGMGAGLYDAAFATLGRIYGADARRAITALTLWGGFASTVCWPVTALLADLLGWRGTCLAYAGFHLCGTVPLCWYALPRAVHPLRSAAAEAPPRATAQAERLLFWLLAVTGTMMAALASLWSVHLMTVLTAQGYTLAAAVAIGALMGPSQVAARIVEMLGRQRHHPIWTAAVSTLVLALSFAGLVGGLHAGAAMIAFGIGNGLWSIARGALPLALFDPEDYARLMGRLAAPALIGSAAAPSVGGLLLVYFGPTGLLWALALAATVPAGVTLVLMALVIRARRPTEL